MLMFWLQSPAPEHKLHEGRNFCIFCFLLYLQHLEWHHGRFKTAANSLTSVLPLARFTEPRAGKARLGRLEEDSGSTGTADMFVLCRWQQPGVFKDYGNTTTGQRRPVAKWARRRSAAKVSDTTVYRAREAVREAAGEAG